MADNPNPAPPPDKRLSRRDALARLGLAAGTAYAAPVVLGLNQASADDNNGGGGDDGGGPPWGKPSKHKSSKGKDR